MWSFKRWTRSFHDYAVWKLWVICTCGYIFYFVNSNAEVLLFDFLLFSFEFWYCMENNASYSHWLTYSLITSTLFFFLKTSILYDVFCIYCIICICVIYKSVWVRCKVWQKKWQFRENIGILGTVCMFKCYVRVIVYD